MMAGEQATIQGLMFLNAGRDERAIEAFRQAQRLPLGSRDIVMSLDARLLASRGDFDAARKLIALEIDAKGASSLTDYIGAQLETRPSRDAATEAVARQGAALVMYIASVGGVAQVEPGTGGRCAIRWRCISIPNWRLRGWHSPRRSTDQDRPEDAIEVLRAVPATSPWRARVRGSSRRGCSIGWIVRARRWWRRSGAGGLEAARHRC